MDCCTDQARPGTKLKRTMCVILGAPGVPGRMGAGGEGVEGVCGMKRKRSERKVIVRSAGMA